MPNLLKRNIYVFKYHLWVRANFGTLGNTRNLAFFICSRLIPNIVKNEAFYC